MYRDQQSKHVCDITAVDPSADVGGSLDTDHGGATALTAARCTALRLRILDLRRGAEQAARDELLWGLPAADHGLTRHLELAYLLRSDRPLEIAMTVSARWSEAFIEQQDAVISRHELRTLAGVALPGFAPVAPELPALTGMTAVLEAPRVDVFKATQGTDAPAAHVNPHPDAHGLHLGRHDGVIPGLDACILALAETNRDVDLVLKVSTRPLDAKTLRALRVCEEQLLAIQFSGAVKAPARLAWCLARLQRWRAEAGPAHIVVPSLRFRGAPDQGLARVARTMLFGPGHGDPSPPAGHADLATAVTPGAQLPALLPTPQTLDAMRRVDAVRYRRPSRKPGLVLGQDIAGRGLAIAADDLSQHCYVIGATGTGKSNLLRSMIRQDMAAGVPVFVCDPHGDLHADILSDLSTQQRRSAVIADASDLDHPFTLNILNVGGRHPAIQRNYIANQLIALFKALYGANKDAFGPMFESYFRAALLLMMEGGGSAATLGDMERVFGDAAFRRALLERCKDTQVRSFWNNIALRAQGEASLATIAPYVTSKLTQLSGNALLRPILCSPTTSLDFPAALSEGRSVFVNLAKGLIGGPEAGILGGLLTVRLVAAAMARPREERQHQQVMRVYLDEFPSYGAHGVLSDAMAEIRKFRLGLVLANQSISQIDGRGPDLAHAILANCGSLLGFRLGPQDASNITRWFGPEITSEQLLRLPNHQFIARTLRDGVPQAPVRIITGKA